MFWVILAVVMAALGAIIWWSSGRTAGIGDRLQQRKGGADQDAIRNDVSTRKITDFFGPNSH